MSSPMDHRCIQVDTQANEVEQWTTIANTYVQPTLSVFGIIGNFFMLLTIHYGHLSDSPYVYLKCIALGDLILLVVIMGLSVARCAICQFSLETAYYLKLYDRYVYLVVSNLMIGWLVLLTLFMTIERFVYVRWPMRTQSWCTRERAKKVCIVLFFVACSSQLMRVWQVRVAIADKTFPKTGTEIKSVKDFHCIPSDNEAVFENRFTCFNDEFPLHLQSDLPDERCSPFSTRPGPGVQRVPKLNQTVYSLDCLHNYCRLPMIPRNLTFDSAATVGRDRTVLEATYMDATIVALTNESRVLTSEDLIGRALFVNNTCYFVVAPTSSNLTTQAVEDLFLKPYTETVRCVEATTITSTGWQNRVRSIYLEIWDRIYILCTVVLTIFNVLIVFVVHKANREAHERVLSTNQQNTAFKRRAEENRLTMSLLALSCVKIFSEIMYITSDPEFAVLFYNEVDPPGFRLKIHVILSNVAVIFEYSSYFYLLAFINRKFKREFLQQVVYGKLLRQKFLGSDLNNFSISSRNTSVNSVKSSQLRNSTSQQDSVVMKPKTNGKTEGGKKGKEQEEDFGDRVL